MLSTIRSGVSLKNKKFLGRWWVGKEIATWERQEYVCVYIYINIYKKRKEGGVTVFKRKERKGARRVLASSGRLRRRT